MPVQCIFHKPCRLHSATTINFSQTLLRYVRLIGMSRPSVVCRV